MDSDENVAALGRPFAIGMLYDARNDKLFTDFTLWDKVTIEKNRTTQPHNSSTYDVTTSDSIDTKSTLLDVQASLEASFLSGLIEVGGSAHYLNDNKKFKNQSRVTLQYKATTSFERLAISHLEAKNMQIKDVIKNCTATHVVTGILYGANAFFVFDSEKLDNSSVQDIQGSMEVVIKKIPSVDFEAKAKVQLTDEEKQLTEKFSCKFYGDFILESNPATFEEAVNTYKQLPQLLVRRKEENTVPVKVCLTPLKNLEPEAPECKGEITVALLRKAENALESIGEIEMRCNDALDDEVVKHFPPIHKKLSKFKDLCEDYTKTLKQAMEKKFPSIRAGTEDGSSLEELFDNQEKSPFSQENLDKWLDNAEREINVVNSCVEIMKGTKIAPNESDFDREILAPGEHALCFVFTSLETDDPFMDQMADYVRSHKSKTVTPPTRDKWFFSHEVFTKMRQKATEFSKIVKGLNSGSRFRFLVAAVPNEKFQGATMYHYKDGILITDDFSRPNIPDPKAVTDRQDLIWYYCDLTLDPNTANNYLTLSENNKKATCGYWQSYPNHPERFDKVPQVLCREGLSDRHYWEVELSESTYIGVAVTYKEISRKGNGSENKFGNNTLSWYVDVNKYKGYSAWHNGAVWYDDKPSPTSKRIGVFQDWPAGRLCFYKVTSNTLSVIHSFEATFTEPLYPGFYIYYTTNYAALCPAE